jgi:uncharacterized protein YdhG (YjbR/CyaY superfamily)
MATATTVSEYIASVPPKARTSLRQIRAAIKKAAPGITERISYRIPTFDLDGRYLLYMAGFKDHVSIYPVTSAMVTKYREQLKPYRSGAGTLRFSHGDPLPLSLITRLARLRVQERRTAGPSGRARPVASARSRR